MGAAPAVDPPPLTVSAIALHDLISAGVASLLQPYAEWVAYTPRPDLTCDVGLVDPDLLPGGRVASFGQPLVAIVRDPGSLGPRDPEVLGVSAVVGPDAKAQDLLDAFEVAHRGARSAREDGLRQLTDREHEILTLVCAGATNADIAAALFLSINSVKTYIRTAYRKMGVHTRSQAILWGVQRGLSLSSAAGLVTADADKVERVTAGPKPRPCEPPVSERCISGAAPPE
jgi:DNA-binding CsgD family transcriptional regulator